VYALLFCNVSKRMRRNGLGWAGGGAGKAIDKNCRIFFKS